MPAERPGTRSPDAPDAAFLDTLDQVQDLARRLEGEELIGLDTEADSFHSYFTKVCLVQVSTRDRDWIIDPLAVESLAALDGVLAAPGTTCVLHGADYDLRILDRDHGLQIHGLFDTMVAARLLGYASFGLSSLLERHFGLKVPKQHQRADWSRRPLTPAMLRYAATDTHFLPELHDILRRELESAGRLAWAQEEFALLEEVRHQAREENPDAYLKLKGARALPPRGRAVLREVYELRDRIARDQDRAPFRVLGNTTLVEIARRQPRRARDLAGIQGMPRSRRRGLEAEVLEAVQRGLDLPESELPRLPRRSDRPRQPEPDLKPLRALRDRLAAELELDPGLVAPNALLDAVARARPATADALRDVPGIRRWQVEAFGTELLAVVAGTAPTS